MRLPVFADADVCIVGGGPAGITLATSFLGSGRDVVLLESGGARESTWARDLNRGDLGASATHEPLEENRRRQWGGASAAWGGRCVPLDAVDLAERDWVPGSGWPIDAADLDRHLARAAALCQIGRPEFGAAAAGLSPASMLSDFDGDVVTDRVERWSPPTHFGRAYGQRLRRDHHTRVLLGHTVTHIQLAPGGTRVLHLVVRRRGGGTGMVRAATYVLAAGGLENARILLASRDVASNGIGNHADQLGRNYMTHLFGNMAVARVGPGVDVRSGFERDEDGVYLRRRFWVTDEAQKRESMLNTIFFFTRPDVVAEGHRDPLFSSVHLAKLGLSMARSPRTASALLAANREAAHAHARVVLDNLGEVGPESMRIFRGRFLSRRRLPMVLPSGPQREYPVYFQAEHLPHPESRVSLSSERDALGIPRLRVAPAFGELERRSVIQAHRLLARQIASSGVGQLVYDEGDLLAALGDFTNHCNSAAHHLGTTRMSAEPGDGVVDADGMVHGVDNLYVTGGSVFATGGHANPTLTIVCLALRLGEHLGAS